MTKSYQSNLIDIECLLIFETDAAILVSDADENVKDHEVWLPKALIEYETNNKTGVVSVTMPEWLANKHGLI